MNPQFITIYTNGEIWLSLDKNFRAPTLTLATQYEIHPQAATQKVGTIGGTTGAYTATANNGHGYGKAIV